MNARILLAGVAMCCLAAAQVPLGGNVYDGNGGPLLGGTVYHLTTTLTVPTGQTLTVQPGAIVKAWHEFVIVDGTLDVNGAPGQPAIFTSLFDDSAGGDTNGDGTATVPAPGDWYGIQPRTGSVTTLDRAWLRFHGYGGWSGLYFNSGSLELSATDTLFADGLRAGIDLNGLRPALLAVSGCTFSGNLSYAVEGAPIDVVPDFRANAANGNGFDAIRVTKATPVADADISGDNCLGGALILDDSGIIPEGITLTLRDGAVLKSWKQYLVVDGGLVLDGSPGQPVVLTSLRDDSVAGDTNHDGAATVAQPGDWYGLNPRGASVTTIDGAVLRYHGYGGWSGLYVGSGTATVSATGATFADGQWSGIDLNGYRPILDVNGCAFTGNLSWAVQGVSIDAVPGFRANTASGNGFDAIRVTNASPVADADISGDNCLGGALVLDDSGIIPAGVTLALRDGAVLKSWHRYLVVDGGLVLDGGPGQPVVLTSLYDDSAGGDTNHDGAATVAQPGDWYGLNPRGLSVTTLDDAQVRYHGYGGWSGLYVGSDMATIAATGATFAHGSYAGIDLNGHRPALAVTDSLFLGNVEWAVQNVRLDMVPGFTANQASGNGIDALHVNHATLAADTLITAANCLGGALVLGDSGVLPAGFTLTLDPDVVVKSSQRYLIVDGTLLTRGQALHPVVFTSLRDDSVAGDTNKDGPATAPQPADWYGLQVRAASTGSRLEGLLVRYAGYGGWPGLETQSPTLTAQGVRIEHAKLVGVEITAAAELADLVAWRSGTTGVLVSGGNAVLRHVTSVLNQGWGVRVGASFTGSIGSSVAWGNGSIDWSVDPAGVVSYSDGLGVPAGTGNYAYDPLIRDAAAGDLRMLPGSPCIDDGAPDEVLFGLDLAGFPRLMDGDLDLEKRADMGAYEFDNLELSLSANVVPGGSLDITTLDQAGFADAWLFVGLGLAETEAWRFGTLFVDPLQPNVVLFWPTVPATIPVDVPSDIDPGTTFVLQIGARLVAAPGTPGNLSNPVILTID